MSIKTHIINIACSALRPFWRQHLVLDNPQSILVIKPCCLGDVVLATAAIAALKRRFPQAVLDVAVGSWSRAVLENNPHIRTLIDAGRVGQGQYGWASILVLAGQLRCENYDLAVILDRSPMVGLLPWFAGIPHRLGLDSYGRGFAHTVRVPVPQEPTHEAQIYLNCVVSDSQNKDEDQCWTEFYPSKADGDACPTVDREPYVILHPPGGVNPGMQMLDKRWPPDHMAMLADRLHSAGFHIVLTGVAADLPLCQEIASLTIQAQPQSMAGALSLGQFGALCQRAALFIGGDTGAMHLAVACGCKTLAIFGPSDPRRYGPFAPPEQAQYLWHPFNIPSGGVGQGAVVDFSWDRGVTVAEAWQACCKMLHLEM